jgi:hypothetical protein
MRLVCGPIPASEVLNPQQHGWTPLRAWGAGRFAVVALLLGLPFLLAAVVLVVTVNAQTGQVRDLFRAQPLLGVVYLLALLAMVPVHELIHGLAYGQGIRSPRLIVGFWPSRGLCYAIYDAPMSRDRVLGVLAGPFLVLSLLPLFCLPWLTGAARALVLTFSLLHTGSCSGDVICFWWLVSQVPRRASVHNNGWRTFWTAEAVVNPAEPGAPADGPRD